MQAGQQVQVLTAHPFFAAIMGMARHRKLSIGQPAAQRFGIDTQATTSVGYRDEGHKATPFVWNGQAEREPICTTTALVWREPNRGLFWGREIVQFMRGSSSLIAVRQQLVPSEQPSDDRSSQGNVCGSDRGRSDRLSNCASGLRGRR